MLIYRVEQSQGLLKGVGPYTSSSVESWSTEINKHSDHASHPPPHSDPSIREYFKQLRELPDKVLFGFKSLESLYGWFSQDEIRRLYQIGFHIVKIELFESFDGLLEKKGPAYGRFIGLNDIKPYCIGDRQAIFLMSAIKSKEII